jgi:hypothetical protein
MTLATLRSAAWVAASRRGVGSGILRGAGAGGVSELGVGARVLLRRLRGAGADGVWNARRGSRRPGAALSGIDVGGVGERGVPDFLLLISSRGARVLWVVRLPRCFLWGVLRFPLESASLAYASSSLSFFHSPFTHSLARTYVPAPAQSSRFPRDAFFSSSPASNTSAPIHSLFSYRTARRSRTFPFPSAESRFPPETGTPPRPIPEGISLRPPIGAEPAFPARGMLAHFPHAFAGGRFSPSPRPLVRSSPPGGVRRRRHTPPPHKLRLLTRMLT